VQKKLLLEIVKSISDKPNLNKKNYELAIKHMEQTNFSCFDDCKITVFRIGDDYYQCPIARKREVIKEKEKNMSPLIKSMSFDNFKTSFSDSAKIALTQARMFISQYSKTKDANMIIYGNVGTGKTHLAVSIMKQLLYFSSFENITFETLSNDPSFLKDENRIWNMKHSDLLILDDLGAHLLNNWAMDVLYDIVDTRYQNMSGTIITTNIGSNVRDSNEEFKQQFLNTFGPRISSRLFRKCAFICMSYADVRQAGVSNVLC